MSEFQEAASYGSVGLLAFVIVKWVLPTINAITSKASVETSVYNMANDQLKKLQERCETLEKLYDAERKERLRLERILNGQHEK